MRLRDGGASADSGTGASQVNIDWLRRFSLASDPYVLAGTLETLAGELAGGACRYYHYDLAGWRLKRNGESLPLDTVSLGGQCALSGQVVASPDGKETATPVHRMGTLLGVLLSPSGADLLPLCAVFGLVHPEVQGRDELRQAVSAFQDLCVTSVEAMSSRRGHVAAVCKLAVDLAEFLDLSAQERRELSQAGLYHDLGKLILCDRGPTEVESRHAQAGAEFLQKSALLAPLASLVAHHHERYDGSGPNGVSGDALSLSHWVLSAAEAFQEFSEQQAALELPNRVALFFQQRSTSHHPDVMDALAGLVDSGRLA